MALFIPAEGLPGTVVPSLDVGPYMVAAAKQKAADSGKYKLPSDGAWERDNQLQSMLLTKSAQVISDPALSSMQKELYLKQIGAALQLSKNYGSQYDQQYGALMKGTDEEKKAYDEETQQYHAAQRSQSIWAASELATEEINFHPQTGEVLLRGKSLHEFSYDVEDYGSVYPFGTIQIPQQAFDKFTTLVKAIYPTSKINEQGDITIKDANVSAIRGQVESFVTSSNRGQRVLREYTSEILESEGISAEDPNYKKYLNDEKYWKPAYDQMVQDVVDRVNISRTLDEGSGSGVGFASLLGINPYLYQDPTTQKELAKTSFEIAGTLDSKGNVSGSGSATSGGRAVSFKGIRITPGGAKAPAYDITGYGITDGGNIFLLGQMASGSVLSSGPVSGAQRLVTEGIEPIFADSNVLSAFYSEFKAGGKIKGKVDANFMRKVIKQQTDPYMQGISTNPSWGSLNP